MTTLASQPCGKDCNEDADFALTFLINSLTLNNADKFADDEKILSITWDGNVIRTMAKESLEEFSGRRLVLRIHTTPMQLNRKLKSSAILMNMTAFCEDLGTVKFPLTDCFCDAILCADFNSQILKNDFKFAKDETENGAIDVDLKIERMDNQQAMTDAIKKSQLEAMERNRRRRKGQDDSDSDDENDALCRVDFSCPNEIPEFCKKHLQVDEHSYRIINGHLVNVKDRKGFCGDNCEAAMKYCKEARKMPQTKASNFDLQDLFKKRTENIPKISSEVFKEVASWKFCKKAADMQKEVKTPCKVEVVEKVACKKKKKCVKKAKVCKSKSQTASTDTCNARDQFVKEMKRKSVGKYSYEFGNTYPYHRSSCSVPNVCEKVPYYMGWRHDKVKFSQQDNKHWRPGQINKIVRILMKHFLKSYPCDTLPISRHHRRHSNDNPKCEDGEKPTLHVTKRDGEIWIEMNPLKDNKHLATDCYPYLNCSPLKFMIKRDPEEIKMHKARKLMKSRGFQKKCNCFDIKYCRCISAMRKQMFRDEMRKVSRELNLRNEMQYEDVHDSSDSEIDFEFTPPAVLDSKYKCQPDVAHAGTQYDFKHFIQTKKENMKYFGPKEAPGCFNKLRKT